jgi:hydrogenase maturation protease
MARILIIGYGNPLRRDDGFGRVAAQRLRDLIAAPDVEIIDQHQLTPELMDPISRAGRVVFIDARAGGAPGEVSVKPVEPAVEMGAAFTHFATPAALLAGAAALYGGKAQGTLVTAGGLDFGIGEGLSEPVQAALEVVLASTIPLLLSK